MRFGREAAISICAPGGTALCVPVGRFKYPGSSKHRVGTLQPLAPAVGWIVIKPDGSRVLARVELDPPGKRAGMKARDLALRACREQGCVCDVDIEIEIVDGLDAPAAP